MWQLSDAARAVFERFPASGSGYRESSELIAEAEQHEGHPEFVLNALLDADLLSREWIEVSNCGPLEPLYWLTDEGQRVRREMADAAKKNRWH